MVWRESGRRDHNGKTQREKRLEFLLIYNKEIFVKILIFCYSIDEPEVELLREVFHLSPRGVLNVKWVLSHD